MSVLDRGLTWLLILMFCFSLYRFFKKSKTNDLKGMFNWGLAMIFFYCSLLGYINSVQIIEVKKKKVFSLEINTK